MSDTLLQLQGQGSAPLARGTTTTTNLLLPPPRAADRLRHFAEEVYDLSPESHLVRLMKVLLGDAGAGQLRKRLMLARLQSTIQGTRFYDLDRFYGALFDARRLSEELLDFDPYTETATSEEWAEVGARDTAYRSRMKQFARAISFGATPTGIELAAEALLSVDCEVHEEWVQSDASYRTHGEIEADYTSYDEMEGVPYSELEGLGLQRLAGDDRRVFTVRPKRSLTQEESYNLARVLDRLRPADSRFVIEWQGVLTRSEASIATIDADSVYWEITPLVSAKPISSGEPYARISSDPVEQPRPPFAAYQGEAWSYNNDLAGVSAYSFILPTDSPLFTITQRVTLSDGSFLDYPSHQAVMPQRHLQAGRSVSDAILIAHPFAGARTRAIHPYVDRAGQVTWVGGSIDTRNALSPLYADRIPLPALVDTLDRAVEVDPFQQNLAQRFWVTPERTQDDPTIEVLEVRLTGERPVNYFTFEVPHFPHEVTAEAFDTTSGEWVEVFRRVVSDSSPRYLSVTPGLGHPQHSASGHWVKCSSRMEPRKLNRFRVLMKRGPGAAPLLAGSYIPYSLGLRGLDVGYRVNSREDVESPTLGETGVIGTTIDALGSLIHFTLWDQPAANLLEGKTWRSEPQPFGFSVVNLYLDLREGGEGQVIDQFFLDPIHVGVHMNLYHSDDEAPFEDKVWTPIGRDYVLDKGYIHLPPTRARYWKMEFTGLGVEPYESFVPMTRRAKLFPSEVVSAFYSRQFGRAEDLLPAGTAVAEVLSQEQRYTDAMQIVAEAQVAQTLYRTTEAMYVLDPVAGQRLHEDDWTFGFMPWHAGTAAPMFRFVQQHRYDEVEVVHTAKVAFFVGLRELRAYRANYRADDDTETYIERFWDNTHIASSTWNQDPNLLFNEGDTTATAVSRPYSSRHNVRAVQFATQQTPPVQMLPDHDFLDPGLATYDWSDPDRWHVHGDAQLLYSITDHSVLIRRHVTPPPRAIEHTPGLPLPVLYPAFKQKTYTVADEAAAAATYGGIESPLVSVSQAGRIYAAVRVTLDTDLSSPLMLQIMSSDGTVLREKEVEGHRGEMIEEYVAYDIGSYYYPPPPPRQFYHRSGVIDRPAQPTFLDEAPTEIILPPPPPPPNDTVIQVRLVQRGKSNDLFRLDTLSLFDEAILWEFSVNGGATWVEARGIRNNAHGVLVFADPGNELTWRVRGLRPNVTVSSLKIKPWYVGVPNARVEGVHRGPNVSTFDHEPPIQEDPEFTSWTKPIPRSWFYASRRLGTLTPEAAPPLPPGPRVLARNASDLVPRPADGATRSVNISRHPFDYEITEDAATRLVSAYRTSDDAASASDAATRQSNRFRTGADTASVSDGATRVGNRFRTTSDTAGATDTATRMDVLPRTSGDTAPASDEATGTIVP